METIKPITERTWLITIPKRDNDKNPIRKDLLNKEIEKVTKHFGGITIIPSVKGCYVEDEKMICEDNMFIFASRDLENPYDTSEDISKFKNECNTPTKKQSQSCINLANEIFEKDRIFMKKWAEEFGNKFGQDTVYINEDISQDVSLIKGIWKKSLVPEGGAIPKEYLE